MTYPNMESDKMLDVYIHDYLVKRKFNASSKTFQAEAEVSTHLNVIDTPGGFLFEWWSIFWDTFIARYKRQASGTVESHNETQHIKEQEQQQRHHESQQQRQQQMKIQELILQRQIQQQEQQQQQHQRHDTQHQNGTANDALARQNPQIANTSAMKMYEECLKLPVRKDPLDDANRRPRLGDNVGQRLDPNHASILKSVEIGGQSPRHTSHGTPGGISRNLNLINNQQQFPVSAQDITGVMSPMVNLRAACSDGMLIGVQGSNQGVNNMPLKGWPLTGVNHLGPGLQQQKYLMQAPQPSRQLQLQRQLMLQAQQNSAFSSASDLECRKLGMILSNQSMRIGKADQLNSVGDIAYNDGSAMQKQMQNSNQHQQQSTQLTLLSQQLQNSNYHTNQQDKIVGAGSITMDTSLSNTSRGNDQVSKNRTGQKRKKLVSSSGPANSSGTANTTGPSPSSAPSTPSTHTTGDVLSMPTLTNNDGSSKASYIFGNNDVGKLLPAAHQSADVDCFVDDGTLDDNVESFLSHDDADPGVDTGKGFTFSEIGSIHASATDCCHLSLDGKVLVTGGHDKKAKLWCTDSREQKSTLEEHSHVITDIRFSPTTPWLATSSLDKTVRVWDVENPVYSLRTFIGHSASVMSLDFHSIKGDLICSCDDVSEIRYWSIKNGGCVRVSKGGATQVRFQPSLGRYLAAIVGNGVSITDVETAQTFGNPLKGHTLNVQSVCWDFSGEHLASVNEDLVRVWKIGPGAERDCIHELRVTGKKFRCCVFHPHYPSLLVIGCHQSLELWNMAENKMMTPLGEPIAALAASEIAGLVASASPDNLIKLWK